MPTEKVVEVRRGRKVDTERKFFPGYVLVKMRPHRRGLPPDQEHPEGDGLPRRRQVEAGSDPGLRRPSGSRARSPRASTVRSRPSAFEIGEQVRVADGPFASFNGVVEEVDEARARLKVAVSIFGRATPVELEYGQVEKV